MAIEKVDIIGAGVMEVGIAQAPAQQGFEPESVKRWSSYPLIAL